MKELERFNIFHLGKNVLCNEGIDRKCKITVFSMCFKKLPLYGAETWTCVKRGN
jgi:hypothetical protein